MEGKRNGQNTHGIDKGIDAPGRKNNGSKAWLCRGFLSVPPEAAVERPA